MTPEQAYLVQTSFAAIVPIADTTAALFYARLFELDPTLRPLFHGDIGAQGRKLMDMLTLVVNGLTRLDTLTPALEELGRRHAAYGVKEEHYALVGTALFWALGQGLGDAFTPEIEAAWTLAFAIMAAVMQGALVA